MICITIDTDWVPETVLTYTLEILNKRNVKYTVFATGDYKCLDSIDTSLVEIGLHPNIERLDRAEETICELQATYPEAVSLRSHSLVHSSRFWAIYKKNSILNTSNYLMLDRPHLGPVRLLETISEYPIYFMDDYYLSIPDISFSIDDLKLDAPGLKVFAFHPIHIYLNSGTFDDYSQAKGDFRNPAALASHRKSGDGIGTLFQDFLDYLAINNMPSFMIKEITEHYQETG